MLLAASLLLSALMVAPLDKIARGESGNVFSLPQPGRKVTSGWSVEVDSRGASATGYRPLRFKAQLIPPGTAAKWDRSLRIEVHAANYWYGYVRQTTVAGTLQVAQGATGGECTILVPQHYEMSQCELTFYEDGERIEDLSGSYGMANWNGVWSEALPATLFIDADAPVPDERANWGAQVRQRLGKEGEKAESLPDLRELARVISPSNQSVALGSGTHPTDPVVLDQLQFVPRMNILPPQSLTTNWLELSSYDLIFVSLADLKKTADEHPQAFAALQAWTTSGRVLCVTGAGADFAKLPEIERLLALPPLDDVTPKRRWNWNSPAPAAFAEQPNLVSGAMRNQQPGVTYALQGGVMVATAAGTVAAPGMGESAKGEPAPQAVIARQQALAKSFVWRRWGPGVVVAMAEENPFPGDNKQWSGLLNALPPVNWAWYQRHGMSMVRQNAGFWNGWIPGIGKAPVTSFLVMISIFVIVIGPVNYVWLWRRKRTFLMLVTVPVGAGLVAFFLVAYAILADGLGVRLRQRSATWIDQRSGRTATWSRQTYYAGLPPRGGLLYPADATVFPFEPFPDRGSSGGNFQLLEWSDEGQRLKTGYVASRTMQQFLVTQANTTDAKIDFRRPLDDQGRRDAVNRLGAPVQAALLRDEQGRLLWSDGGDDRGPLKFEPISASDARQRLSDLLQAAYHDAPEGTDAMERSWSRRYSWGPYNNVDSQLPQPNTFTGLLETQLRQVADIDGLARRSYVVFTARSPLVPLGVERYEEQGSLHVIFGQW